MDAALFGMIVADVIAEPMDLRHPPVPGGLQFINSIRLATGGSVCNTGMAMARLGMRVAGCGMVGDDLFGRAIIEQLESAGVAADAVFLTDRAPTSATVVAVEPGGERSFLHAPGVVPLLDAALFRQCFATFRRCAWLHIGYFGLLPSLTPHLPRLLSELRLAAPALKIALDTAYPPADMAQLLPILPHLDLFAPSRPEASALTGEHDPAGMVASFRRHMPRGIIGIKLDRDGCMLDDGSATISAPAYEVKVIDTTGAGDAWFAGMLVAQHKDMPLLEAARLANRVAADCCTALGASAGIRSLDDTLARL